MPKKIFSCIKCGAPIEVYPPDDLHPDAARDKNALIQNDIIKIDYTCEKCKATNTLYWGSKSMGVAII